MTISETGGTSPRPVVSDSATTDAAASRPPTRGCRGYAAYAAPRTVPAAVAAGVSPVRTTASAPNAAPVAPIRYGRRRSGSRTREHGDRRHRLGAPSATRRAQAAVVERHALTGTLDRCLGRARSRAGDRE